MAGVVLDVIEKPVETYVAIETSDNDTTFVSRERELVTVLRVTGTRDIKGSKDTVAADGITMIPSDLRLDATKLMAALKPTLSDIGHGIEIHYSSDPDRGKAAIAAQLTGARAAASNIGLDLSAFHDAQEAYLGERAREETCHLVLWTMPTILAPVERKQALETAVKAKSGWAGRLARSAQDLFLALAPMRNRHDGFVKSVVRAFADVQVETSVISTHAAGRDIYESLWQGEDGRGFRLCLPTDPAPVNVPRGADPSAILWPRLGRQLAVWGVDRIDWETARFGARIMAGVDVAVGPEKADDFARLRDPLARANVPFRVSMRLRSGGARQLGIGAQLASFGSLFGGVNGRVRKALERVTKRADDDGCVTWQCSLATWAEAGEQQLLQSRLAELRRCAAQWGTMQVRSMSGNPVEGVLSSALGLSLDSTAETGYAPLEEVFHMLPRRVASPWQRGSIPFLTADGSIFPYEAGSDKVGYHFTILTAAMRSGKSALLAVLVEGNILAAGTNKFPFLVYLDIGFGSSGIIETLRESLPHSRRGEVQHAKMQMTSEYCMNIFDPPLGCRTAPPDQRAMIEEAITLLVTPAETEAGHPGMAALIPRLVEEVYRLRDEKDDNGEPNRYVGSTDGAVDDAIAKFRIATSITTETGLIPVTWWRITDALFEAGDVSAALRAQRFAAPQTRDLLIAIKRDGVKSDFGVYTTSNDRPLLEAVEAELKNAMERFPICNGVTQFDPAGRVIALDLQDVVGKGSSPAAKKTTNIVYTWCMVALTNRWYAEPRDVAASPLIPEMYRKWHLKRAEDLASTPKIFVADEFHQTAEAPSARNIIKKMVRTGPKYAIRVTLSSQVHRDYDDELQQLASTIILLSYDDEGVVREMAEKYNLSEAQCAAIRQLGTRDPRYGVPMFIIIKAKTGRFAQLIFNAMSPRKLWSVATNPREVNLRRRLTAKVGSFTRAVALLAAFEPFQARSAEDEIATRIARHLEQGNVADADENKVIDELVAEMVALERDQMRQRMMGDAA